jgi:plasmid stabilization system protein ParE
MKIYFHTEAKKELLEAINYYNEFNDLLGSEFVKEFYSAIERIKLFPGAWSKLSKNTRRCLLNRFPYGIIYSVKDEQIIILAVIQLNKKPTYWKNRE